jgi:phage gp36-like protein
MPYITVDDLIMRLPLDRLIALTDDEGVGSVNQAVIDHAISTSSSEIDGYVGVRYKVPFDAPHPVIQKLCQDLTIYYLHLRLDRVTDDIKYLYDNAVRLLRDVSKGVATLGVEPEPEASGHLRIVVSAPVRVFGPEELDLMP